jgi:hypothetical protein
MLNRLLLGVLALALAPLAAWGAQAAGGSTPLDSYLDNLKTLRATFLQVLVDAHDRDGCRRAPWEAAVGDSSGEGWR